LLCWHDEELELEEKVNYLFCRPGVGGALA